MDLSDVLATGPDSDGIAPVEVAASAGLPAEGSAESAASGEASGPVGNVAQVLNPEFPDAVLIDMGPGTAQGSIYELWPDFVALLESVELASPARRIVRVWHPAPNGQMYTGKMANAPLEVGAPAYQWDNGDVVGV